MRPEAFAGGSKDDSDTYMVRIWSRGSIQDSDGKTISDTPEDSLLLRMESGETYEVGFSTYDLTAKPGTVFYVSARNLKRYTFYEAYQNTIRLDLYGVKFGEGPYDPATGICEFKIASEFNEAMKTAKPDDRTRQLTFSKDNEQIKFKVIIVGGNDDDSVMLGVKEE